ncbi:cytochrome b/b6 domain-containing protein [Psychromonas sp. KJ10-10]|uniref:cytochrome b/b6 domain-containing protein n=1 Tax=Psychromonas sp. KJ10-10 TaxID=3391823 RepID=UPI0039B4A395
MGIFRFETFKVCFFFPTPKRVLNYISAIKKGKSPYVAGHNPLGSLMVFVMIILVCLQAVSGLFIDDGVFSAGPYHDVFDKSVENVMKFIHHNFFDFMIIAIVFHISAIAFYWKAKSKI